MVRWFAPLALGLTMSSCSLSGEREATIAVDSVLFPSHGSDSDIQDATFALIQRELMGDVGGLCDNGITCQGRVVLRAGTAVTVSKSITLKNNQLDESFSKVKFETQTGWVASSAIRR